MEKQKTNNSPFEWIPICIIENIVKNNLWFYLNPENFLDFLDKEIKTKSYSEIIKNLNKLWKWFKEISRNWNNFCTLLLNILIQEDIDILNENFKNFYFEVVKITKEEIKKSEGTRSLRIKTNSNVIQLMPA